VVCGKRAPRREVGTMGYLVMGIVLIVLVVIAAVRARTEHA
jgi:hypothetical protein